MRIKAVLLRWYKSFNVNYERSADRVQDARKRPWNDLRPPKLLEGDFPFIEIPLEKDITTVVGANESGKSHLISAITKVLTGKDVNGNGGFGRTDLCHYAAPHDKNAALWPNIGLQFEVDREELKAFLDAAGQATDKAAVTPTTVTLILAPEGEEQAALLFVEDGEALKIDAENLETLRKKLPVVMFIDSEIAIADKIPLTTLISEYEASTGTSEPYYDHQVAQKAAILLAEAALEDKQKPDAVLKSLQSIQSQLRSSKVTREVGTGLEVLLFERVLNIRIDTLKHLLEVPEAERGYAESLVSKWNGEIDRVLNLSQYWQQDEDFTIRLNYKHGMLFFEITDKTGCVYTFRERSSGLKYFLSYYIQAKAISESLSSRGAIILMDEPDSFLSILGQRNLLAIFESLVETEEDGASPQLLYTTHSPFLINRNFPNRLRLVRKGDAEEGTQYIDESRIRRYEPIRSALGVGCAQTLFMGAVNVLLEGPTDQFLLVELIRSYINKENAGEYLDLNEVVFAPADGAQAIEHLLAVSRWGDEVVPTAVVLVDDDDEGRAARERITAPAAGKAKLSEQFVLLVADCFQGDQRTQKIVTSEDLLTPSLYAEAVKAYVAKWYPDKEQVVEAEVEKMLRSGEFGRNGLAVDTRSIFRVHVFDDAERRYDKLGVLQLFFEILPELRGDECWASEFSEVDRRLRSVCQVLKERIAESARADRRRSGKTRIKRIVNDFMSLHRASCPVFELKTLFERLARETKSIGPDAAELETLLTDLLGRIRELRSSKQELLKGQPWAKWEKVIMGVKKNPLNPQVRTDILDSEHSRETEAQMSNGDGKFLSSPIQSTNEDAPEMSGRTN